MTDNNLPTFYMTEDELIPEGVYQAECTKVESIKEGRYIKFTFRILDFSLEKNFANGLCETRSNRSSSFVRWVRTLSGIEFSKDQSFNLNELQHDIIGNHCFVRIKHKEKDDRVFDNVVAVYPHDDSRFIKSSKEE